MLSGISQTGDDARLSAQHGEISALLADPISHRNPQQSSAIRQGRGDILETGNMHATGDGETAALNGPIDDVPDALRVRPDAS